MVLPSPGTISVRAHDVDLVDGVCGTADCAVGGVPMDLALIALAAIVGLAVLATLREMSKAGSVVAEERERTRAERDAFADFERQLSGLEPARHVSTAGPGATVAVNARKPDGQIERLKDAYRETVMEVPHFEEEYDEPIQAHMTAELGQEAAAAVFDGQGFTPQVKGVLLNQCEEARTRRDRLLDALDREEARLTAAGEKLRDIDGDLERAREPSIGDTFEELRARWQRLGDLEDACQAFLREQQSRSPEGPATRAFDGETLREYLYGSLPTQHPVLADGTRLLERIRQRRRDTMQALTRRT